MYFGAAYKNPKANCKVCGKSYIIDPKRQNTSCCSLICTRINKRRISDKYAKRYFFNKKLNKWRELCEKLGVKLTDDSLPILKCCGCKQEFIGKRKQINELTDVNFLACGDRYTKCGKKKRTMEQRKRYHKLKGNPEKAWDEPILYDVKCVICGVEFKTNHALKNTCGDVECYHEKKRREADKTEEKHYGKLKRRTLNCSECGKEFKTRPLRDKTFEKWQKQIAKGFEHDSPEKYKIYRGSNKYPAMNRYCSKECLDKRWRNCDSKIANQIIQRQKALNQRRRKKGKVVGPLLKKEEISQDRIENEKALLEAKRVWKEVTGKAFSTKYLVS